MENECIYREKKDKKKSMLEKKTNKQTNTRKYIIITHGLESSLKEEISLWLREIAEARPWHEAEPSPRAHVLPSVDASLNETNIKRPRASGRAGRLTILEFAELRARAFAPLANTVSASGMQEKGWGRRRVYEELYPWFRGRLLLHNVLLK